MSYLAIIFWACAALVLYAYALYPGIVWVLARVWGRTRPRPASGAGDELPGVTVLIAAHNEEAVIGARLESALRADYPTDRFRIVVASDGSCDRTTEIVRRYADRGVTLLDFPCRAGKSEVLNASMRSIDSELVLLSDANTDVGPAAARTLAGWFADPAVGAVCGRLVLTDPASGANVDSIYWRYETFLKKCEDRLDALLGSNGAVYAIRRRGYVPVPAGTIVDDFVIPLLMKQATGCRIVYDARAVATEEAAPDVRAEFRRRARIGAGGFQAIGLLWRLLDPRRGWISFTFLSHKVLRWTCPFFLLGMLASSLALSREPVYRYAVTLQIAFYLAAWLSSFVPSRLTVLKPLRLATMFAGMNVALLVGFWRWVSGTQAGTWNRTDRRGMTVRLPAGER